MRTVKPSDVQAAYAKLTRLWAELQKRDEVDFDDSQIAANETRIKKYRSQLWLKQLSRPRFETLRIAVLKRMFQIRNASSFRGLDWYMAGLIAAAIAWGGIVLGSAAKGLALVWVFAYAFSVSALVFALVAFFYLVPGDEALVSALSHLVESRATRQRDIDRLNTFLDEAIVELRRLAELATRQQQYAELKLEYEQACREHDDLKARLGSRKNQLLSADWRSLRGDDFEQFLVGVFEVLGYATETTKASGDQGVDLIATKGGSRIAIQAKGYANSVGNSAVQQAVAGKMYYNCDSCVVITNSSFTRGARDLADKTECRLIDGTRMDKLINGEIF
jgi:low affinity Fe/Cu permease